MDGVGALLGDGLPGDGLAGDGLLLTRMAMIERRLQSLTRIVLEMRGSPAAPDGLHVHTVIEADSPRDFDAGFHDLEHDAAGNPFRWAGKDDHFEFRFHLDRFAARPFRMIGQFAAGVRPDQLRAYVDYRSVQVMVECEAGPDGAFRPGLPVASGLPVAPGLPVSIVGRIPADPLGGAATLTFHCPAVPSPNPVDRRKLSFAFVRLIAGEQVPPDRTGDRIGEAASRAAA